jgi:hypothetical protein
MPKTIFDYKYFKEYCQAENLLSDVKKSGEDKAHVNEAYQGSR